MVIFVSCPFIRPTIGLVPPSQSLPCRFSGWLCEGLCRTRDLGFLLVPPPVCALRFIKFTGVLPGRSPFRNRETGTRLSRGSRLKTSRIWGSGPYVVEGETGRFDDSFSTSPRVTGTTGQLISLGTVLSYWTLFNDPGGNHHSNLQLQWTPM